MGQITRDIEVLDSDPVRIDLVIQRNLQMPRSTIRGLFSWECVKLNDVLCADPGTPVSKGMRISLRFDPETRYREKPKAPVSRVFTLVFEDDHLLVVNKTAGFLTVPTAARESNTLVSALYTHVNRGRSKGRPVAIVHRLDRDTSGLLVFAKNSKVAEQLKNQFAARKPEREYLAVTKGKLKTTKGSFRSFLATDKDLNQYSTKNEDAGKLAITHFSVIASAQSWTLVRVTLETGRRNQIRVHFAEAGHPILGDSRYETDLAAHPLWPHRRLALHARVLGFTHPITGAVLRFVADIPQEFLRFGSQNLYDTLV